MWRRNLNAIFVRSNQNYINAKHLTLIWTIEYETFSPFHHVHCRLSHASTRRESHFMRSYKIHLNSICTSHRFKVKMISFSTQYAAISPAQERASQHQEVKNERKKKPIRLVSCVVVVNWEWLNSRVCRCERIPTKRRRKMESESIWYVRFSFHFTIASFHFSNKF